MDDKPVNADEVERTPKVKLAPMTEWRLPTPAASPPSMSSTPDDTPDTVALAMPWPPTWPWIAGAAGAAIVFIIGIVAVVSMTDSRGFTADAPVPQASAPSSRARAPVDQPIMLPGGLMVDRSSPMNYDLALWLGELPTAPRKFTFDGVAFSPGDTELGPEDRSPLQGFAIVLGSYPTVRATITVHGPAPLGEARAKAIRNALLAMGLDGDRLAVRTEPGTEAPMTVNITMHSATDNGLDS